MEKVKSFKNSLDEGYTGIINKVSDLGYKKGDRTGYGTISYFGTSLRHDMSKGFPLLTQKEVHFKSVESELYWFLNGFTNIQYLTQRKNYIWVGDAYKRYIKENGNGVGNVIYLTRSEFIDHINNDDHFASKWGDMGKIYGYQWRHGDIDQLQEAVNLINENPDSRRIIVDSWNVKDLGGMVLPPCHNQFQFWTRDLTHTERVEYTRRNNPTDKTNRLIKLADTLTSEYLDCINVPKKELSVIWRQRSVDVGLGLPFNIASYGLLLNLISKLTNTAMGDIIAHMGDTHIYTNHYEELTQNYMHRDSHELPSIEFEGVDFTSLDNMVKSLDCGSAKILGYKHSGKFNLPLNN